MTLKTEFNTLWLSPGNFQSAGSILTNDESMCFNVMGLSFDSMPVGSSIEGTHKKGFLQKSNSNTAVQYAIPDKLIKPF